MPAPKANGEKDGKEGGNAPPPSPDPVDEVERRERKSKAPKANATPGADTPKAGHHLLGFGRMFGIGNDYASGGALFRSPKGKE